MIDDDKNLVIENASADDLASIASIHKDSLGVGILSNCGTGFLIRMYAAIMKSPSNSIVVARYRGKTAGFIVGIEDEINPLESLDLVAIVIFLFNCLRKPYLILTTSTVFRKVNRNPGRPGDIEISHFAVDDEFREMGIGSRLISVIEDQAQSRGLSSVFTRTHNERLVRFYKNRFKATEEDRVRTTKIDYVTLKWQVDGKRRQLD